MLIEYDDDDPVGIISARVITLGRVTYVGKDYIKPLKKNTHAN